MPIRKVPGGYKWGNHGKVYKDRKGAEKQAAAAHANGFQEGRATAGFSHKKGGAVKSKGKSKGKK